MKVYEAYAPAFLEWWKLWNEAPFEKGGSLMGLHRNSTPECTSLVFITLTIMYIR